MKNKCFLFQTDQFGKKIDQDFLNQYNIQQYNKNKYEKDFLNYEDQQNHMNKAAMPRWVATPGCHAKFAKKILVFG